ncbi:DUF2167 domain-containing protein [Deinococcus cellulosilyticus]|uniref:Uncharacterized protein n=1 Tax=Deinococcus cellulosilyticus (strain DSM 18568 / NBRC 106333 / KACC 11606 / 5516J-15) TaxID=1223518 RepID=A0A511N7N4_DEIC1|nr:DUF2167 domain-containing protein [Deinococcus cellulosilyticus]GEM48476.1 hypothetical protein DC3_41110 [Deinococcus cellulosilyticus NBRC 106333 = KACC 11606]
MLYNPAFLVLSRNRSRRVRLHKWLLLGCLLGVAQVQGHGINNPEMFDSVLHYQTAETTLPHHLQVQPASSIRFLNSQDANHVIYDVWGGSPDSSIIGMLLPRNLSPVSEGGWGLSLQHLDTGYVDARRWKNIDAKQLLKTLQKNSQAEVLNWALPPTFNPQTGVLMFATEVKLPGAQDTAIFPKVLLLGREGLLLMKGIIEKKHWEGMKATLQDLAFSVTFQDGYRYTDVQAGDRLYDYGMTALITETPVQDPERKTSSAPLLFPWIAVLLGLGLMGTLMGKRVRSASLTVRPD